jgi:hypothetical protein
MSEILTATAEINGTGGMSSHLFRTSSEQKNRGWEVHYVTTNVRGAYFDTMSKDCNCYDMSSSPPKNFLWQLKLPTRCILPLQLFSKRWNSTFL